LEVEGGETAAAKIESDADNAKTKSSSVEIRKKAKEPNEEKYIRRLNAYPLNYASDGARSPHDLR
jgi:hypothetical protein